MRIGSMKNGTKLKLLRKSSQLFQRELAELLNVHPSQISRYETNRDGISDDKLNALNELFNINMTKWRTN